MTTLASGCVSACSRCVKPVVPVVVMQRGLTLSPACWYLTEDGDFPSANSSCAYPMGSPALRGSDGGGAPTSRIRGCGEVAPQGPVYIFFVILGCVVSLALCNLVLRFISPKNKVLQKERRACFR